MSYLLLLLISVIMIILARIFLEGVSWKEMCLCIVISVIIILISVLILHYKNMYYTEIINGYVVKKFQEKTSCSHSYECRCIPYTYNCGTSKYPSTCIEKICSTCYDHTHDFNWVVEANTRYKWYINRIDSQGVNIPPRFAQIKINDPVSYTNRYKNYLKASNVYLKKFKKLSLGNKYKKILPKYPIIYDYYKIDRILTPNNFNLDKKSYWNNELSLLNGEIGYNKQCNIILVLLKNEGLTEDYISVLEGHWRGGQKNDIIIVISIDNNNKIVWTDIITLSKNSFFEKNLKNQISLLEKFDIRKILTKIEVITISDYDRKEMKNFEYLTSQIQPSILALSITGLINFIISLSILFFFHKNEVL